MKTNFLIWQYNACRIAALYEHKQVYFLPEIYLHSASKDCFKYRNAAYFNFKNFSEGPYLKEDFECLDSPTQTEDFLFSFERLQRLNHDYVLENIKQVIESCVLLGFDILADKAQFYESSIYNTSHSPYCPLTGHELLEKQLELRENFWLHCDSNKLPRIPEFKLDFG